MQPMIFLVQTAILGLSYFSFRRYLSGYIIPLMYVLYNWSCAFIGILIFSVGQLQIGQFTFYNIGVTPDGIWHGANLILSLTTAYFWGAISRRLASPYGQKVKFDNSRLIGYAKVNAVKMIGLTLPLILLVIGSGFGALLRRFEYIPVANFYAQTAGRLLAPIALLYFGICLAGRNGKFSKIALLAIFLVYELVFFSLATRLFAIGPVLLVGGYVLIAGFGRRERIAAVLVFLLLIMLQKYPLEMRGLSEQGLFPFVRYVLENQGRGRSFVSYALEFLTNLTFTVPLTEFVSNTSSAYKLSYLLTSLNPMPGAGAGWYDIVSYLRVSNAIPFNFYGELIAFDFGFALIFLFVVGYFFGIASDYCLRRMRRGSLMLPGLILGLSFMFAITVGQYNLRSSSRILYYTFVIILLGKVVEFLVKKRPRH